jgi:hypothetical protein
VLSSSIGWILIVSGVVTAAGGVGPLVAPALTLRLTFGVDRPDAAAMFFLRHWGVLVLVFGALLVYSANAPSVRFPVLVAAAVEKAAIVAMVFFGPLKRTPGMTAIAAMDGLFAIVYAVYLVAG